MTARACAPIAALRWFSMAVSMRASRAVLDAVGADRLGADDSLGDGTEHVADPLAHLGVAAADDSWNVRMMRKSGTKQTQHDQAEHRAVDEHEDRRERDLGDVDHEHQAAELHEHRDRVDVGRDPRDERAAPLRVLRQHRQVMDVAERLAAATLPARSPRSGRAVR